MTDDWLDLLRVLHETGARFLVVGAHALAAHGIPRGTQDLEIWIDRSADNAARVWKALALFRAPLDTLTLTQADLESPGLVVQIGLPPNRIDLLTSLSGVEFRSAWPRRLEGQVRSQAVPFIGRDDLKMNKLRRGARRISPTWRRWSNYIVVSGTPVGPSTSAARSRGRGRKGAPSAEATA